jgi:hypothetical protein
MVCGFGNAATSLDQIEEVSPLSDFELLNTSHVKLCLHEAVTAQKKKKNKMTESAWA